jgi:succinate-acetate transporter protein
LHAASGRPPAAARRPPHLTSATPPPSSPAAPLGLYGFALTTALLQGSKTHLTEPNTAQLAVSFGFFFGGLAQFCAGLLEYQRRNTFGTVAFCW